VRTGSLAAEARDVMPPVDCMTKIRDGALRCLGSSRTPLQIFQVPLHYWLEVGVDYHCGGALVLPEFWEDLVGDRERYAQRLKTSATANSFLGFANEKSSEMAMESGCFARTWVASDFSSAGEGVVRISRRWQCVPRRRSEDRRAPAARRDRRRNRTAWDEPGVRSR